MRPQSRPRCSGTLFVGLKRLLVVACTRRRAAPVIQSAVARGRIVPGATLAEVTAQLAHVARELAREHVLLGRERRQRTAVRAPGHPDRRPRRERRQRQQHERRDHEGDACAQPVRITRRRGCLPSCMVSARCEQIQASAESIRQRHARRSSIARSCQFVGGATMDLPFGQHCLGPSAVLTRSSTASARLSITSDPELGTRVRLFVSGQKPGTPDVRRIRSARAAVFVYRRVQHHGRDD